MVRTVALLVCIVLGAGMACFSQAVPVPPSGRVPLLVELFTSEGCSSCPPADSFVQSLDVQPFPGIEIVLLAEHVDYWDRQGWRDRYSSPEFTERQRDYGRQFNLNDVYTPQLVIDGCRQMSGNNATEIAAILQEARTWPKTAVHITQVGMERDRLRVRIETAPLSSSDTRSLDVYLAVALNHAESQVRGGENANRHLTHAAVVRKITQVGKVKVGERFFREIEMKIQDGHDASNLRVVAFLQDSKSRRVFGAAMKQVQER